MTERARAVAARSRLGAQLVRPTDLGLGELFFAARDAVIVGEAESGRIVLWNDAARRLLGYSEEEAIGCLIEDLLPDRLKPLHRAGLERYVATGTGELLTSDVVAELVAVHKSGREVDVELTLTPLQGEDPNSHYAMAIIRDVSERKRSAKDLEDLNQSLRDFVAIAAHDMRNPLSVIVGMTSVLEEAALPEADRARVLQSISRSAKSLSRLVDDLLAVSKLEAGVVEVHPVAMPLVPLAEQIVDDIPGDKEIVVRGDPSVAVLADPGHVERLLRNYVTNAITYGEPPFEVSVEISKEGAIVSVRDQGPGVEPDLVERLFEKFARSSESHKKGGTGLGLAIVRGLARANGGEAWYEPATPGSCFRVRLPVSMEDSGRASRPRGAAETAGGG